MDTNATTGTTMAAIIPPPNEEEETAADNEVPLAASEDRDDKDIVGMAVEADFDVAECHHCELAKNISGFQYHLTVFNGNSQLLEFDDIGSNNWHARGS